MLTQILIPGTSFWRLFRSSYKHLVLHLSWRSPSLIFNKKRFQAFKQGSSKCLLSLKDTPLICFMLNGRLLSKNPLLLKGPRVKIKKCQTFTNFSWYETIIRLSKHFFIYLETNVSVISCNNTRSVRTVVSATFPNSSFLFATDHN